MRLRYRVDGRARLIGPAGQSEQAPDVFDLKPEIAGMPDKQQPALQLLPVATLPARGSRRLWHEADLLVVAQCLHGVTRSPRQLADGQIHARELRSVR